MISSQLPQTRDFLAKAMKILGHDGAGITPRTIQRGIGHVIHEFVHPFIRGSGCRLQDGFKGEGHVGAGVTVRNRKNIDAVQVFPALEHVADTGRQRTQHARRIKVGNGFG